MIFMGQETRSDFTLVRETTELQVKWVQERSLKTGCIYALDSA
jgi:hypothetical protein